MSVQHTEVATCQRVARLLASLSCVATEWLGPLATLKSTSDDRVEGNLHGVESRV